MEFGILGPLEVRADGHVIELGGVKPRAVLAMLALNANQPVSAERLAVALWGEDVPPSAVKTVQVYVARLRKALHDPEALVTTPAGYCLRLRPGELDADRFERQVKNGREALAAGRGDEAAAELRQALELWRGPPLAEFASTPFAPAEIARLEEQQLGAVEVRVEADLAAGRHAELIGELGQLTREHPWRERLHAQLMLALYRAGRQADALEAYRHAREVLVDELGIEPGAELHDLHEAILAQDPGLDRSAEPAADGLRAPPNPTIGREREIGEVGERLRSSEVRLLTLTGPGGVGKTRLALEAARSVEADFADGAHFVALDAVQHADDVASAIVKSLGIIVLAGESDGDAVARFVASKHMLLVTDNFEQVLAAAPLVGDLLAACPGLTVLATSREPLALQVEQRQAVPPLALPDEGTPNDAPAVALFAARARAHDPAFELDEGNASAVAEICRRVDGLPLAIELAAARCGLMSAGEIAQRLERALSALGTGPRDAPARQRTLHATVDWSHDLLGDEERAAFARFAVFAGGATVEAAEAVTGADLDTLDRLVAKSLLVSRRSRHGPTRLAMLETIRAYAAERFADATDAEELRWRHYRHYLEFARVHSTERALWGARHREHLAILDAESENLEAALRWAIREGAAAALELCAELGTYWDIRDRYADVLEWTDRVLGLAGADAYPALRVRVLCFRPVSLLAVGRTEEQPALLAEAEATATVLADRVPLSRVLQIRATYESALGRSDAGHQLAVDALRWAETERDEWAIAMAAYAMAMAAADRAARREHVDRAAVLLEQVGNLFYLVDMLGGVAYDALRHGDDGDAREFVGRAMAVVEGLDYPYLWMQVRGNFALASLLTGEIHEARRAFRDELRLCRKLLFLPFVHEGLQGLAAVAAAEDNDVERAARLAGAASVHRYGAPVDPVETRVDATFIEPTRSRVDADAWEEAFQQGAGLSFEQAIAYALEETGA